MYHSLRYELLSIKCHPFLLHIYSGKKQIESELESSVKEEDQLVKEFKFLLEKIETSLEISEEIDHILLTCLTNAETQSIPDNNSVSVRE